MKSAGKIEQASGTAGLRVQATSPGLGSFHLSALSALTGFSPSFLAVVLMITSGGKGLYLDPSTPSGSVLECHWCCPALNQSRWPGNHGELAVSGQGHMLRP